ncbi:RDD family protein [Devosia sp. A16]|uniref:RDD family protein n=1 Tax=Devosia sp. A16 TaxID=1736675 RepID=UPI0006D79264|nr:RDD family protein [Devosia sp. A16]
MQWYYSADGAAVGPRSAADIEDLFVARQITSDTLVWRKGLADWVALGDTEEFAHLADTEAPPAPPEAYRQAMAQDGGGEAPLDTRHADDDARVATADDHDEDDDEPAFEPAAASAGPRLAGPWERYFARSIDLTIILSLLVTGLYLVLPSISPQLALDLYNAQPGAVALLLLPLALFINAGIITLCGNSLGKAIFAIRAEPIDGRQRFGFGGTLKREFTVWLRGLALGIPVFNLFTMVPAYRAVGSGKPAPYDIGRAAVRSYSNSQLRSTLGMVLGMLLYLGIFALNGMERAQQDALAQPSNWTHPTTQITTTIPAGWQYEALPGPDGTTLHGFGNAGIGIAAFFVVETFEGGDMAAYTAAVTSNLGANATLGAWSMSNLPGVWKASGQMLPSGYASTVYAARNGTQYWRIVYVNERSTTPREISDTVMSAALFRSAGIGAQ